MKAVQDDGSMLCDEILSWESYEMKARAMGIDIAPANYQQEPIDIKGRLYSGFKIYTDIPRDDKGNPLFTSIGAYVDTADQGSDYLCAIVYVNTPKKPMYLTFITPRNLWKLLSPTQLECFMTTRLTSRT